MLSLFVRVFFECVSALLFVIHCMVLHVMCVLLFCARGSFAEYVCVSCRWFIAKVHGLCYVCVCRLCVCLCTCVVIELVCLV